VLVASLVLAGQLGVSAHLALVPHTMCAVHGALIHAGSTDVVHAVHETATTPEPQPLVTARPEGIGHDDDEHCGIVASRRELAAPPARPAALGDSSFPPQVLGSTSSVTMALEASFRLAPKQSPPASLA